MQRMRRGKYGRWGTVNLLVLLWHFRGDAEAGAEAVPPGGGQVGGRDEQPGRGECQAEAGARPVAEDRRGGKGIPAYKKHQLEIGVIQAGEGRRLRWI